MPTVHLLVAYSYRTIRVRSVSPIGVSVCPLVGLTTCIVDKRLTRSRCRWVSGDRLSPTNNELDVVQISQVKASFRGNGAVQCRVYRDNVAYAVQKRLNQSSCSFGW